MAEPNAARYRDMCAVLKDLRRVGDVCRSARLGGEASADRMGEVSRYRLEAITRYASCFEPREKFHIPREWIESLPAPLSDRHAAILALRAVGGSEAASAPSFNVEDLRDLVDRFSGLLDEEIKRETAELLELARRVSFC